MRQPPEPASYPVVLCGYRPKGIVAKPLILNVPTASHKSAQRKSFHIHNSPVIIITATQPRPYPPVPSQSAVYLVAFIIQAHWSE